MAVNAPLPVIATSLARIPGAAIVSVLLASTLKKSGAAYRACEEATAATSAENSEVLPLGSVAVALMIVPAEAGNAKLIFE